MAAVKSTRFKTLNLTSCKSHEHNERFISIMLAIMVKNVPAPLETGDFGGGESGTKQGVRRTESRKREK